MRRCDYGGASFPDPDNTRDRYSYNALGQSLSHTDADGRTTSVVRSVRGLPVERRGAKGQRVRYRYDQAQLSAQPGVARLDAYGESDPASRYDR